MVPICDLYVEPAPELEGAWIVHSGFLKADGSEITFFLSQPEGAQDMVLNDACGFLKDAVKSGIMLRQQMLADLARTYGLKLTDGLALFDDSKGDLAVRKYRFAQCLVALDGVLRMWGSAAPARINPKPEEGDDAQSES